MACTSVDDFELLGYIDTRQYKVRVSLQSLVECELFRPDIQRLIDYERVAEIIQFQKEYFDLTKTLLFVGDITVAELDERFYVIDGLHRLEAIKSLVALCPQYQIGMNIVECGNKEEMIETFITINKSVPVPEHVIRNANNTPKLIILEEFRRKFQETFKGYISSAQSPHRPNINEHNMMYYMNNCGIERQLGKGELIYNYMLYVNDKYLSNLDNSNTKKCKDKAEKLGCKPLYISNDKEYNWLKNEKWIKEFIEMCFKSEEIKQHVNFGFTRATKGDESTWHDKFFFWKQERKKHKPDHCDDREVSKMSVDMTVTIDNEDFVPCSIFQGPREGYEYKFGDNGVGYYKTTKPQLPSWTLPSAVGRKAIPKQVRGVVWRNYFQSIDHECPLCTNTISLDDFECGHIQSVKNGGSNHPNNLIPLCGKCNKSMSVMNLEDYVNYCGLNVKFNRKVPQS
jgi:hypothetical protein